MSAFRFRFERRGGHTHVRLFAGRGLGLTLGKCGDLVFENGEWEDFTLALHRLDDDGAVTAAEQAQCQCSVAERESGHLIGCWMPALSAAIAAAKRPLNAAIEIVPEETPL